PYMAPEISEKQLAANRRSRLLVGTTGPKTPEGKARVKWNALKHGLLAGSVVIPSRHGSESRHQFKHLLTQLHDELNPVGMLEEMLVEKIAVAYWRLRRALRAETRQICDNINDFRRYHYQPHPGTLALPSTGDTYKIVRYESAIERQLHRAIYRLERLQDRRQRGSPQPSEELPVDEN
ncbi:MAG TPA: hypothetical protein VN285_13555, partial [Candidatus Deferrimicrobium sp.]|nr:hypothetical protein [Candidatus Deferrimicrobium sp.]